jgi:hypothetical protein
MKLEFIVAVRNDSDQLLILHARDSEALVFPSGSFDGGLSLHVVQRQVLKDTGLDISGIHLVSTETKVSYGFVAYVAGGKLRKPPSEQYIAASWVAYALVPRIMGLSPAALDLMRGTRWMLEGPPH